MMERFERIPGVQSVGLIGNLHLNTISTSSMSINVDGVEPPPGREDHNIDRTSVDPGFFDAAGIRIMRGRNFNDRDLPDSPQVAIINQAMARKFWPVDDCLGRMIRVAEEEGEENLTVVGVASDAKIRSIGEAPLSFICRPFS